MYLARSWRAAHARILAANGIQIKKKKKKYQVLCITAHYVPHSRSASARYIASCPEPENSAPRTNRLIEAPPIPAVRRSVITTFRCKTADRPLLPPPLTPSLLPRSDDGRSEKIARLRASVSRRRNNNDDPPLIN